MQCFHLTNGHIHMLGSVVENPYDCYLWFASCYQSEIIKIAIF